MNHYEALGVAEDATDKQIKDGYRRAAMDWHPDHHDGEEAKRKATAKFKEIHEAYRTLKDAGARADYDASLKESRSAAEDARAQESAQRQRSRGEHAHQSETAEEESEAYDGFQSRASAEGTGGDEANQMFFEQMLDLAFELASRGFAESGIAAALTTLGCPSQMAAAVAKTASTVAARRGTKERDPEPYAPFPEISQASWEQAEPFYRAFIQGQDRTRPMSDEHFQNVRERADSRRNVLVTGVLAGLVPMWFSYFWYSESNQKIAAIYAISVITLTLLYWFTALVRGRKNETHAFARERRVRNYLSSFRSFHSPSSQDRVKSYANSAALLFPMFWLAYRKLYVGALISSIACAAIWTLLAVFAESLPANPQAVSIGISLLPGVIVATLSGRMLFSRAQRCIDKAIAAPTKRAAIFEIRKRGGTNVFNVAPALVLAVLACLPSMAIIEERDIQARAQAQAALKAEQDRAAAEEEAAAITAENAQNQRYGNLVAEAERRFPFLNPESPSFDQRALDWVAGQQQAHMRQGHDRFAALQLAVRDTEDALARANAQRGSYVPPPDVATRTPRAATRSDRPLGGAEGQSAAQVLCSSFPAACSQ